MRFIIIIGATLIIVVPLGAFFARQLTHWIAGFKPRYAAALLSTFLACATAILVAWGCRLTGVFDSAPQGNPIGFLIGMTSLACFHFAFLKSGSGTSLTAGKAFLIAILQLVITLVSCFFGLLFVGLILGLVARMFP